MADRRRRREQISAELDQIFLKHTTEEWLQRFQGKIPVAPINDLRQALENPLSGNRNDSKIDHPTKPEIASTLQSHQMESGTDDISSWTS